jgi:membrane protein YqaA with SNARE-associated domain
VAGLLWLLPSFLAVAAETLSIFLSHGYCSHWIFWSCLLIAIFLAVAAETLLMACCICHNLSQPRILHLLQSFLAMDAAAVTIFMDMATEA